MENDAMKRFGKDNWVLLAFLVLVLCIGGVTISDVMRKGVVETVVAEGEVCDIDYSQGGFGSDNIVILKFTTGEVIKVPTRLLIGETPRIGGYYLLYETKTASTTTYELSRKILE